LPIQVPLNHLIRPHTERMKVYAKVEGKSEKRKGDVSKLQSNRGVKERQVKKRERAPR